MRQKKLDGSVRSLNRFIQLEKALSSLERVNFCFALREQVEGYALQHWKKLRIEWFLFKHFFIILEVYDCQNRH